MKCEAENLKQTGNDLFKNCEYISAISQYSQALQICPLVYSKERSILHANRAAAKAKCQVLVENSYCHISYSYLSLSASDYFQTEKDSAISDCTKAIELNSSYVKAYIRRAQLYEETDKLDEALEDFKKVLTFDPNHTEANHAIRVMYYLLKRYRYLKYYLSIDNLLINYFSYTEITSIN